ncbi:MAG: hypothetical protein P8Y42_07930 [Exilibacterium sp.]
MTYLRITLFVIVYAFAFMLVGCSDDDDDDDEVTTPPVSMMEPVDVDSAERATIDRFSATAGTLFVRNENNSIPEANAPVNFDQTPFITKGLGPDGELVEYYNFDIMPAEPAPIYVLFYEGEDTPVPGQLNIVDVIPGESGYNDFWQVHKVTVPSDYVANAVTSLSEIMSMGYDITATPKLVNCPIVPEGSTATKRLGDGPTDLMQGWYQGMVVNYFSFEEKALTVDPQNPVVTLSPIHVSFNINPDQPGGGPASGFMTETGTDQTHNVVATLPDDAAYSPYWLVNVYDNSRFDMVEDLATATDVPAVASGVATVNCPVVSVKEPPADDPADAEHAMIDRFSGAAGTLFVRDEDNGLPEANAPINFDQAPFITKGLGPDGELVEYYNFDVMPALPAPIYVLFREGEDTPVPGQFNIVDVIPGDQGYNDFWQVHKVTVPADYVANSSTSLTDILSMEYDITPTPKLVNCPIVPEGSTATKRLADGSSGLIQGWYQGMIVNYFSFEEKALTVDPQNPTVSQSPIYVSFNINPGQPGGGPASGFMTETGTDQTHNVVATLPDDADYAPYWLVNVYDNTRFDLVEDLATATAVPPVASGVATVNCPVVSVKEAPADPVDAEHAMIDRFSGTAGTLFVRNEDNGLPEANAPINFDQTPFITKGLGPDGEMVEYYNFDVMPALPAPIYVLFREGEDTPVPGQFNIVNVIPGEQGYNDFWQVHKVTVPADYVANTITSLTDILSMGYEITATPKLVNCPIVPEGSTATKRLGDGPSGLIQGWYQGMLVSYFSFEEKALTVDPQSPVVTSSPIYVSFNINPGQPGGGPASGFMTETGTDQTHNVVATLPDDADYAPYWLVNVYDNSRFDLVEDLATATAVPPVAPGVATVNCPIVSTAL